ncbi:hypothetical protein DITRI_Ditri08aG0069200 [Diplodiscus trichospermus]
MKMETIFDSTADHPHHSYPSFTTEFNTNSHEPNFNFNSIFNDAYLQPFLPLPSDPSSFNFFTQDFPSLPLQPQLPDVDYSLCSSSFPPNIPDVLSSTHFFHFFSKSLPDLHSLEQPPRQPRLPGSSSSSTPKLKRTRLDSNVSDSDKNPQNLDSIFQSFNSPPPIIPHSELARKRRQKLSEKIRCLQKLMPWDKKMDTGTMLEEAYKYIQFLQAQISILQSMPITSCFLSNDNINAPLGFDYAGLGRLNRQQLLQVLVNSPVAQTMLYSQGFCVFSHEQLVSLKKAMERKTVFQQFALGTELN